MSVLKTTYKFNFDSQNFLDPNVKNQISTWLTSFLRGNYVLKNGDTLTLTDFEAVYFRDNYFNNPDININERFITVEDTHVPAQAEGTALMLPVGSPVVVSSSSSGNYIDQEIALSGGTFTEAATVVVDSLSTIAGQSEADFNAGEALGTFTGGDNYSNSDTITMTDGTVVTVDVANVGEIDYVIDFTITSASTTGITSNNTTLTQVSTSGSGSGFTLTLGVGNQGIFAASYKQSSSVNQGVYSAIPADPVSGTDSSSFNVDWGVQGVTITDGGNEYEGTYSVSFSGGGGTGATGTAVLTDDVVSGVTITATGSGYSTIPSVTIDAP